jgi:hypothetical protein
MHPYNSYFRNLTLLGQVNLARKQKQFCAIHLPDSPPEILGQLLSVLRMHFCQIRTSLVDLSDLQLRPVLKKKRPLSCTVQGRFQNTIHSLTNLSFFLLSPDRQQSAKTQQSHRRRLRNVLDVDALEVHNLGRTGIR